MKLDRFDFRIWDNDRKCFVAEPHNAIGDVLKFADSKDKQDSFVIELWNGRKDNNGTKIYAGDIVRYHGHRDEEAEVFIVDFMHDDGFNFCTIGIIDECEVLGNIHENPELICEYKLARA